MSTTHGHSLTHHTHVTTTRVYPRFRPGARSRYRCLLLSLWRGGRRVAAPFPRENAEGRENRGNNKHGHRGRTACSLFSFACHTNFFPSASWLSALTPRLHLRLELLRPGPLPLRPGCYVKDQTQSSHSHTHCSAHSSSSSSAPLGPCANCASASRVARCSSIRLDKRAS